MFNLLWQQGNNVCVLYYKDSISTMSKNWKPESKKEASKLASSQSGWSLAGSSVVNSRTRGKRTKDPPQSVSPSTAAANSLPAAELQFDASVSVAPSTLTVDTATTPTGKQEKPPHSRVIVDLASVIALLERNMVCRVCQSSVSVSFPTKTIASGCRIDCNDELCTHNDLEQPTKAAVPLPSFAGSPKIKRMIDCEVNVL